MQIRISNSDGVPIYRQIVNQVKYLVAAGRLTAGDQLLPVRTLAEQLVVNPNTVSRAYRELESAGVITARQGSGAFVTDNGSPLAMREKRKVLQERVDMLLAEADSLDVDVSTVIKLLRDRSRNSNRSNTMSDVIVEFDRLSRNFGAKQALNEVTLSVERGSVFGLVGENGAGKTTLIRHVLGLLKAKQGSVRVFNSIRSNTQKRCSAGLATCPKTATYPIG